MIPFYTAGCAAGLTGSRSSLKVAWNRVFVASAYVDPGPGQPAVEASTHVAVLYEDAVIYGLRADGPAWY